MKNCGLRIGGCLAVLVVVSAGCQTSETVLPMQRDFGQIQVNESTATDVLNMLPDEGMLQTANSVCAFNRYGWSREIGIVRFSEAESTVERKDYLQHRSNQIVPLFKKEEIRLAIQTVVGDDVLSAAHENDMRKNTAILWRCHELLIEDFKPFVEDLETVSLMGLARSALEVGIRQLTIHPRRGEDLLGSEGFVYDHPTLNKCMLFLRQDGEDVFTIRVNAGGLVDPWVPW